jgi:hypothetical protein
MFLRFVASALLGLCLCASPALFAQEEAAGEQPAANALTQTPVQEDKAPQWVWGEVVSMDQVNKQIVIKHLDYETYEEVQTTLKADDKTIFENISGLSDIRPKDHITVDYNTLDNVNIAELVVVDKEQAMTMDESAPSAVEGTQIQKETESVANAVANQSAQAATPVPAQAKQ